MDKCESFCSVIKRMEELQLILRDEESHVMSVNSMKSNLKESADHLLQSSSKTFKTLSGKYEDLFFILKTNLALLL